VERKKASFLSIISSNKVGVLGIVSSADDPYGNADERRSIGDTERSKHEVNYAVDTFRDETASTTCPPDESFLYEVTIYIFIL
jgi:hypothetical protein